MKYFNVEYNLLNSCKNSILYIYLFADEYKVSYHITPSRNTLLYTEKRIQYFDLEKEKVTLYHISESSEFRCNPHIK